MSRVLDGGSAAQQTRVRGGLSYAYAYGDQPYGGKNAVENFEHFKLRLQIITLTAGVDLPSGTGASLALPMGRIRTDSDARSTDDYGIGDLEVRARQDVFQLFNLSYRYLPRVSVSAGIASPTGPYVSKLQIAKLAPGQSLDKTLSLGRGAWWLLADVEAYGRIIDRLGYFVGMRTRTPLSQCEDGFQWGEELQFSGGLSGQIVPKYLTLTASIDYLDRAMPTEIDWLGVRVDSASVGGKYTDATVSVRSQILENLAIDLTGRKPLAREVYGLQTPPNYWIFAGISWNMTLGEPKLPPRPVLRPAQPGDTPLPEIAALLVPATVTIVDYWATWCAPCLKLSAQMEEFAKGRSDFKVVKVEATDWNQEQMDRLVPAVPGLPVVDIYAADGKLIQRLAGADAFDYAKFLPADTTPVGR